MKNALGVPFKVFPSSNFRIVGSVEKEDMNELEAGQSMELEYSVFEAPQRGRLSALYRQESSVFSLNLGIVLRSTVCSDSLCMGRWEFSVIEIQVKCVVLELPLNIDAS